MYHVIRISAEELALLNDMNTYTTKVDRKYKVGDLMVFRCENEMVQKKVTSIPTDKEVFVRGVFVLKLSNKTL